MIAAVVGVVAVDEESNIPFAHCFDLLRVAAVENCRGAAEIFGSGWPARAALLVQVAQQMGGHDQLIVLDSRSYNCRSHVSRLQRLLHSFEAAFGLGRFWHRNQVFDRSFLLSSGTTAGRVCWANSLRFVHEAMKCIDDAGGVSRMGALRELI
jgi:hypothetical protein